MHVPEVNKGKQTLYSKDKKHKPNRQKSKHAIQRQIKYSFQAF